MAHRLVDGSQIPMPSVSTATATLGPPHVSSPFSSSLQRKQKPLALAEPQTSPEITVEQGSRRYHQSNHQGLESCQWDAESKMQASDIVRKESGLQGERRGRNMRAFLLQLEQYSRGCVCGEWVAIWGLAIPDEAKQF